MAIFTYPPISVSITGGATEAKQDTIITKIEGVDTSVQAVDTSVQGVDTSVQAVDTKLTTTNSELSTLNSTDFSTSTKQDTVITTLGDIKSELAAKLSGSLAPVEYDEVVTTYVGATSSISTVVYKLASATVKTLTFTYDGSDRLSNVVAS